MLKNCIYKLDYHAELRSARNDGFRKPCLPRNDWFRGNILKFG
jgi:hypothetical protein